MQRQVQQGHAAPDAQREGGGDSAAEQRHRQGHGPQEPFEARLGAKEPREREHQHGGELALRDAPLVEVAKLKLLRRS